MNKLKARNASIQQQIKSSAGAQHNRHVSTFYFKNFSNHIEKRFQNPFFKTSYDHNSKHEEIRTQLDPNFDAVRTRRDINPTFINYDDFFKRKTSQLWLSKEELAKKELELKEKRRQIREKILKNRDLRRSRENIERVWNEHN